MLLFKMVGNFFCLRFLEKKMNIIDNDILARIGSISLRSVSNHVRKITIDALRQSVVSYCVVLLFQLWNLLRRSMCEFSLLERVQHTEYVIDVTFLYSFYAKLMQGVIQSGIIR